VKQSKHERILDAVEMIICQAPPCPDPAEGGCIGKLCTLCAAREIRGLVNGIQHELEQAALRELRT